MLNKGAQSLSSEGALLWVEACEFLKYTFLSSKLPCEDIKLKAAAVCQREGPSPLPSSLSANSSSTQCSGTAAEHKAYPEGRQVFAPRRINSVSERQVYKGYMVRFYATNKDTRGSRKEAITGAWSLERRETQAGSKRATNRGDDLDRGREMNWDWGHLLPVIISIKQPSLRQIGRNKPNFVGILGENWWYKTRGLLKVQGIGMMSGIYSQ